MKRLSLLKLFLITVLLSLSLLQVDSVLAVEPPRVDIAPSSTLYPFQHFTVNVTLCSAGDEVHIELFEDGAHTAFEGAWVPRNPDGSASLEDDGLREIRSYTVKVNCGGEVFTYVSKITVEEFTGTITLRHEQTQPNTARVIAEGCPPNSEVKIDWARFLNETASIPWEAGQRDDISDQNGKAETSFSEAGVYQVDASCGGANSEVYHFTITEDGSQGAVFPTLPDPPEPPCGNLVDGKCMEMDTPLGTIRTDGIGIIYTLFVLILSLSGGILVIIIMYAGYLLMISRGNPEQIQKAREILIAAIVGFLFIIFSYVIFGTLTDDILHLPGFRSENCLPNDASCVP